MFWDKSYTPSQNIEALLEKENATVEEFLDDDDILLECRSQKKSIVNYFTRPDVIKRLVELITTEPSEDLPLAQRYRHAHMACEILTLGWPSLDEKLLSDEEILKTLYSYLENEPPLNPLLSSFFSKTFSMLFTKKAEQDWFLNQQMCLQLLEYIKSQNNFLDLICKHFSTPVIPDLIMQMMREVEGQMKRNVYEWLTEDKLVERLIELIGNPQETEKHANVAEFLCDLIQQGRSMRYTEQENDSFEPTFDGSNPILKSIESERNVEALLNVILEPNAHESAVVSGISVVLMLLKPVVFTDEPNSDRMKFIQNREKEIREQILSTVICVIAPRLKDFNELLRNPPNKPELVTTAAKLSQPFGMTRLQICRIFTVLLQTKNETILKAVCETDFFETLLTLFKQYCWNNFLHSEVEKCLQLVFYTKLSNNNNSMQGSTIVNDGSFNKTGNTAENTSFFDFIFKSDNSKDENFETNEASKASAEKDEKPVDKEDVEMKTDEQIGDGKDENATEVKTENTEITANANAMETDDGAVEKLAENEEKPSASHVDVEHKEGEINEQNKTKAQTDSGPSALQKHVIENCKLISKLIDCWKYNTEMESAEKGRRLGYMGHLIKIFKHITNSISESEHIGALIECNLSDEFELKLWQSIINPTDGDLTKALATQSKMLANCNAHEAGDYSPHLSKDFDNSTWDYIMSSNMINNLGFSDSGSNFGRNIDDDDDEDEENNAGGAGSGGGGGGGTGSSLFGKSAVSTSALQAFGVTNNPWDDMDPFSDLTANSNATPWTADFNSDNFADFDSHFSSFANDLGESLVSAASTTATPTAAVKENSNNGDGSNNGSSDATVGDDHQQQRATTDNGTILSGISRSIAPTVTNNKPETGYDNNANVEKSITLVTQEIGEFADGTDVADDDLDVSHEKALATSLVRTLQSVMQDSEDDYEDDEGMWTKPLGGSAVDAHDDESDDSDHKSHELRFTNGPSSNAVHANDNTHKLNKTDDDDSSTIAATHINDNEDSENVQVAASLGDTKRTTNSSISLDAIADVGCNATAVAKTSTTSSNAAVEIAPTTT
uniref:Serine/threonine-protein phosphatase 6 regulatory subunit 2 n=1 Tax=Zeugodacus cucurbitae TaxID=28588 RepID=A0A0A1WFA3_ZEUCU